jgi:hypothetical protein
MAQLQLKSLAGHDLARAHKKAEKYRDLNEPEESDSICRDILAVEPGHQAALRTLGLALTDRYAAHWAEMHSEALAIFAKLESEYERVYYTGVAWERYGKAQLAQGIGGGAYLAFLRAVENFERAQTLAAKEDPDPILRWNRCVRELASHPLLVAAAEVGPDSDIDIGDGPPG